jgi:hypothetical protein
MNNKVTTIKEYLEQFSKEEQAVINRIRTSVKKAIDPRFKEQIAYNMIGYVVPFKYYPKGYHVDPKLPLTYVAIARQKNYFSIYHMGTYFIPKKIEQLKKDYSKNYKEKLNMGKSCLRFRKEELIPFKELTKILNEVSFEDYIKWYDNAVDKIKKGKK